MRYLAADPQAAERIFCTEPGYAERAMPHDKSGETSDRAN